MDGAVWSDWCVCVFEACNIALSFELGCYPDPVTTLNPLDTEFLVIRFLNSLLGFSCVSQLYTHVQFPVSILILQIVLGFSYVFPFLYHLKSAHKSWTQFKTQSTMTATQTHP